ncbi:MAG: efflux RND transporter periplasmic adaptor subunit, partial [Syntrophales bacterium]|nr:efflux RND transporter periplasmic adaptor subunit [Syntrophales bacterium]
MTQLRHVAATHKKKLALAGVVIIATVALLFYLRNNAADERRFRTEKAVRGDIIATVTATGKVDAVTTVIVGTQISGMIKELFVDYNSPVKKNQLLARIDPAIYEAQLMQAKANYLAAQANLEKAEAMLADAQRTLARYETLIAKNFIARSELDTAKTAVETSQAQVSAAYAQVKQAEAALKAAETNLHYTQIRSPVDGMVISRNVDVGQTVAASFQTPTLFSIAKDLTDMQIITSVDEADIGKVYLGQPARIVVEAFKDRKFDGRVTKISPLGVEKDN